MVFNVFICFIMFFDICSIFFTAGASLQLVPNSKFRIQNSESVYPFGKLQEFAKVFFFITLKEHLEAQLRHTLWQTLRVCQSFFSSLL